MLRPLARCGGVRSIMHNNKIDDRLISKNTSSFTSIFNRNHNHNKQQQTINNNNSRTMNNTVTSTTRPIHNESSSKKNITSDNSSNSNPWFDAKISSVTQLTSNVTGIMLTVPHKKSNDATASTSTDHLSTANSSFTFSPGQWVDFCIPNTNTNTNPNPAENNNNFHDNDNHPNEDLVGGYSITSIPSQLPLLHLAIQHSNHPVAMWVANSAMKGHTVKLRVGGNFILDEFKFLNSKDIIVSTNTGTGTTLGDNDVSMDESHHRKRELMNTENNNNNKLKQNYLFIAGGVGINPLFSMMNQIREHLQSSEHDDANNNYQQDYDDNNIITANTTTPTIKVALIYSISHPNRILFQKQLSSLQETFPNHFHVHYVVTDENYYNDASYHHHHNLVQHPHVSMGRISSTLLQKVIHWFDYDHDDSVPVVPCNSSTYNNTLSSHPHNDSSSTHANIHRIYICGPPGMPESMVHILSSLGSQFPIPKSIIKYEKWW